MLTAEAMERTKMKEQKGPSLHLTAFGKSETRVLKAFVFLVPVGFWQCSHPSLLPQKEGGASSIRGTWVLLRQQMNTLK